jgi:hypothetical protein
MSVSEVIPSANVRARPRAKRPRSAVTSGRHLLLQGNPNSAWSRRYHDLISGHVSDLGGPDLLSEAQAALVRDAACLEIELERMRGRLSDGEKVDLDLYGRVAGQRRRILESIGLKREARDAMTPLDAYRALLASQRGDDAGHIEHQSTEENAPPADCGAVEGNE